MVFLWVGLGGALGAMLRFGLGLAVLRLAGAWLPWGTLLANAIGSFGLGYAMEALGGARLAGVDLRIVVGAGVFGGFTTYSSFNLETLRLLQQGALGRAALYAGGTFLVCLAAGLAGLRLAGR